MYAVYVMHKINNVNTQRQEYERFLQEKGQNRGKSGDFRKKTELQGTFKIGGEAREIRIKNFEDRNSNITENPNRNYNTSCSSCLRSTDGHQVIPIWFWFSIWFAKFQILISEQQTIWRKLLVLS